MLRFDSVYYTLSLFLSFFFFLSKAPMDMDRYLFLILILMTPIYACSTVTDFLSGVLKQQLPSYIYIWIF